MKWVKYSTAESIKNREITIFAVFEVFFSVTIYWSIAIYFNFYWHIIGSILVTPFFLLSSKKSRKEALLLFSGLEPRMYENKIIYYIFLIIIWLFVFFCFYSGSYFMYLITIPIAPALVFMFLKLFIVELNYDIYNNLPLFFDFDIKKISLGFIILLPIVIYYMIFVFFSAFFLGYLIKVFVTIKYIRIGINNLINNWKYQNFFIDFKKYPEIIPDIESYNGLEYYKLSDNKRGLKVEDSRAILVVGWSAFIIKYFFGIFYRLSIKATFWFYLPILFLVKSPNKFTNSNQIGYFLSLLYETKIAKIRLFIAFLIVLFFLSTYFSYFEVDSYSDPFATLIMFMYFDFSDVQLWKLFQIIVASLTIFLYLYSDFVRTPYVSNEIEIEKDVKVMSIYYLNRFRNLCSFFYFLLAIFYISYFFKIWENPYIPAIAQQWLEYLVSIVMYQIF